MRGRLSSDAATLAQTSRSTRFARKSDVAKERTHTIFFDILFVLGFFFLSGALTRLVATGELTDTNGGGIDAPAVTYIGISIYLVCLIRILIRPLRPVGLSAILAVMCCFLALLSALWAGDPAVCLRRAGAFTGSIFYAYLFVTLYSVEDRLRIFRLFAYVFVAVNLVAVAIPGYGIHSSSDLVYADHAGRWRGVFGHKNALAQAAAIVFLILLASGSGLRGKRVVIHMLYMAGAIAIVSFSLSAQIFLALPFAIVAYLFYVSIPHSKVRILAFVAILVAGILLFLLGPFDALLDVLAGVVGRDATFSNRTLIWQVVVERSMQSWVLGGGYGVAWKDGLGTAVKAVVRSDPGHPHNGFLQTWIDLGVVGLSLVMALIITTTASVVSKPRPRNERSYGAFCLAFLFLYILVNLAGSEMMGYNSIYWTLLLIVGFSGVDRPTVSGRFSAVEDSVIDSQSRANLFRISNV